MTNPAMGWLVLRRAAEKRPPLHPDQRKWGKFFVRKQPFSSESQFGLEIRQGFGKLAASEAANGKSRLRRASDLGPATRERVALPPSGHAASVMNTHEQEKERTVINATRPEQSQE